MNANLKDYTINPQFQSKPYWVDFGIVILLAVATVVINFKMIRDGLNGLGDLLWHITWVQHFYKEIAEGIWYPRWLAGTNYGYGSPTFVFYPPLVYYLGSALKLAGLNIEQTMIVLFSLALFLSGITCYIYGRNKWGKTAAFIASLFYITVPSLINIIYFGGLAGLFAIPLLPLGLYLTDQALLRHSWKIPLAIFWALMALTHVPSLLICTIAWTIYILFSLLKHSWKAVIETAISAGLGFGIVSFYLLPAILEQPFVSIGVMSKSKGGFQGNLVGSSQLPLLPLHSIDRQVYMFIHQSLAILFLMIVILLLARKHGAIIQQAWHWLVFAIALAFLMSYWSLPIWQSSRILQMIQFPLRLLGLFSLAGSALCGLAVSGILKLKPHLRIWPLLIIIGLLMINFRFGYQLSRANPTLHNPGRGKVENIDRLQTALYDPYTDKLIDVPEYRPLLKDGKPVAAPLIGQPPVSVVNGKAAIQVNQWHSYNRLFNVTAEETSTIKIRTYYFPAWHLYVNNNSGSIDIADDGTMQLKLEPGSYQLQLRYQWTHYLKLGVILSIVSFIALVLFGIKRSNILALETK